MKTYFHCNTSTTEVRFREMKGDTFKTKPQQISFDTSVLLLITFSDQRRPQLFDSHIISLVTISPLIRSRFICSLIKLVQHMFHFFNFYYIFKAYLTFMKVVVLIMIVVRNSIVFFLKVLVFIIIIYCLK